MIIIIMIITTPTKTVTRLMAFLFLLVFYFSMLPNLEDFGKLGLGPTTM